MRRWLVPAVLVICVLVCGCKTVSGPERERQAEQRREKASQDMVKPPNGEDSPFGS